MASRQRRGTSACARKRVADCENNPRKKEFLNIADAIYWCKAGKDQPGFCVKKVDDIIGRGVFTTKDFHAGDFLLEYAGELISHRQALKREQEYSETDGSFLYFFRHNNKVLCLDATFDPFELSKGRFVNDGVHEEKNCCLSVVVVAGVPHLCNFALRFIKKGEELRYDYGVPNLPWRKKKHKEKTQERKRDLTDVTFCGLYKESFSVGKGVLDPPPIVSTAESDEYKETNKEDILIDETTENHQSKVGSVTDVLDSPPTVSTAGLNEHKETNEEDILSDEMAENHQSQVGSVTGVLDSSPIVRTAEWNEHKEPNKEDILIDETTENHQSKVGSVAGVLDSPPIVSTAELNKHKETNKEDILSDETTENHQSKVESVAGVLDSPPTGSTAELNEHNEANKEDILSDETTENYQSKVGSVTGVLDSSPIVRTAELNEHKEPNKEDILIDETTENHQSKVGSVAGVLDSPPTGSTAELNEHKENKEDILSDETTENYQSNVGCVTGVLDSLPTVNTAELNEHKETNKEDILSDETTENHQSKVGSVTGVLDSQPITSTFCLNEDKATNEKDMLSDETTEKHKSKVGSVTKEFFWPTSLNSFSSNPLSSDSVRNKSGRTLRHKKPARYVSTDLGFSDSDNLSVSGSESEYVADSDSNESDTCAINPSVFTRNLVDITDDDENTVTSTSDFTQMSKRKTLVSDGTGLQDSSGLETPPKVSAANPSESFTDSISSVETPTSSTSSITVMSTSKSNESRVYDKRFYCLYCDKPQSKLPRHLLTQHAEEIEVAKYDAETDKNIKAQMICRLRNLGNHRHNSKVIQEGCGMLIVVYRPKGMVSWEQYVPCDLCLGYYVHWDLWKHRKRCTLLPKDKKVHGRVVSHNRLLLPTPKGTSVGLQSLLVTFNSDLVSRVVKSDPLILQLGEKLYHKLGHDKDQFSTIRNTLRELGRLLRSLRQSVGPTDAKLADFINPLHFQAVVSAAKEVAGFSEKTHLFRTPSLALKVGHSIKKCAKILKGNALQVGDEELLKKSTAFWELCELSWTEEISTHALRTLGENKRNVVKLIPLTSDCKLLTDHLKQKGKCAFKALEVKNSNREAWSELCEAALSQIILFNRRRHGEVSKMTVTDFVAKHSAGEEDVMQSLSPLEQKLCKSLVRIEIVGKRGRTVPVILTAEMKQWIDLLLTTRKTVSVNPENIYLFARSSYGSLTHVRGCDCLRVYSEECGAKFPKLLRSTKLRKQIATLSQLLNMKENELDILANFLGHDVRVHREFYRLPESTLQVAKVSKLLFSLENGQFSKQQGNSLSDITIDVDEDIGIEVEDQEPSDEDDGSGEETNPVDDVSVQDNNTVKSVEAPRIKKRPWSEQEKMAVKRHLDNYVLLAKIPNKQDIEKCICKEACLRKRTWRNIKDYVRNQITTKKRRAGKLF